MENINHQRTSFLPNHGYFVTTLSDDEDDDNFEYGNQNCRSQDKEKTCIKSTWSPTVEKNNSLNDFELHSCNISNKRFRNFVSKSDEVAYKKDYSGNFLNIENMFFSQLQFKKSKACSEASNYSLQQSLQLLMGKNKHEELYEHLITSPDGAHKESMQTILKQSLQVGDRMMQQKIMEPTQEIVTSKVKVEPKHLEAQYKQAKMEHFQITSNVAYNLDAYSHPIDMEINCNKPQRNLPIEAKKLRIKVCNNQYKRTSNCVSSLDLQDVDWKNNNLEKDANVYSNGCSSNEFSSRQPQEVSNDLKTDSIINSSQNITYSRAKTASQKMKKKFQNLRLLQQIKEESLQKHSTNVNNTMLKNHDLVKNCCRVVERSCLENKHQVDFVQNTQDTNDNQIIHKRTNLEAFCEQKDKRMICKQKSSSLVNAKVLKYNNSAWALSKTKVSHNHGSSNLELHLTNQSELEDQGNTSWNFGPVGKSQATIQSNNIVSNNKKIQQVNPINLNSNISSIYVEKNGSNYNTALPKEHVAIDISKKIKFGISSNKKVKEQILSTLNSSRRTQHTSHKTSKDMAYCLDEDKKALDPKSPHSNILRERKLETLNVIDYKSLETDKGTMSEPKDLYKFEVYNICDEKNIGCNASYGCEVATTLENSHIKINPRKTKGGKENRGQFEIKCVPLNFEENEDMRNKKLPTSSSTIEDQRLQVSIYDANQHGDSKEPYKELHLQNIKFLKPLEDLQFEHQTSKICDKKIICMTDPALQCGYLAQYLKTKKMGVQEKNHLSTLHK